MDKSLSKCLAGAVLVLLGTANVSAATAACDRTCLKDYLNTYLNAMIMHDPSAAPLWAGFRETENAIVTHAGNGAWKTFTGFGKIQRRFADPVTQQAGYFGEIEEAGGTAIVSLRLKIEKAKITEAEWVISRNVADDFRQDPKNLELMMPPDVPVSKQARTDRDLMIAAANSYFDGIETHDSSVPMATVDCIRLENGMTTAGARVPVPGQPGKFTVPRGCTQQFEKLVQAGTPARRYPIVDEEAGFVLGMTLFMRAPGSTTMRNLLNEWFQIDHGKIIGIYAAMHYLPQAAPAPNWPPYDMNWPLPVPFAPAVIRSPPPAGTTTPGGTPPH
ncbi:MAG TPA: hypothetical protein VIY90_13580 [Steroidobacteraceae bacterium]